MKRYDYSAFDQSQYKIDVHKNVSFKEVVFIGLPVLLAIMASTYMGANSLSNKYIMVIGILLFCAVAFAVMIFVLVLANRQDSDLVKFAEDNRLKASYGKSLKEIKGMDVLATASMGGYNKYFSLLYTDMGKCSADIGTFQYSTGVGVTHSVVKSGVVRCKLSESTWSRLERAIKESDLGHGGVFNLDPPLELDKILSNKGKLQIEKAAKTEFTISIMDGWLFLQTDYELSPSNSDQFERALVAIESIASILDDEMGGAM